MKNLFAALHITSPASARSAAWLHCASPRQRSTDWAFHAPIDLFNQSASLQNHSNQVSVIRTGSLSQRRARAEIAKRVSPSSSVEDLPRLTARSALPTWHPLALSDRVVPKNSLASSMSKSAYGDENSQTRVSDHRKYNAVVITCSRKNSASAGGFEKDLPVETGRTRNETGSVSHFGCGFFGGRSQRVQLYTDLRSALISEEMFSVRRGAS